MFLISFFRFPLPEVLLMPRVEAMDSSQFSIDLKMSSLSSSAAASSLSFPLSVSMVLSASLSLVLSNSATLASSL